MTAANFNLTIMQGSTFSKSLYLGQGTQVEILSFADAGSSKTTITYKGKDPTLAAKIIILGSDFYTGTHTVASLDATANTFTISTAFQANETKATWMDPFDLTGHTYAGQIRTSYTAASETESFTTALTDATGGHLTISMTSTETAAIAAADYVYDIEQTTTAGGAIERILEGVAKVTPEATK